MLWPFEQAAVSTCSNSAAARLSSSWDLPRQLEASVLGPRQNRPQDASFQPHDRAALPAKKTRETAPQVKRAPAGGTLNDAAIDARPTTTGCQTSLYNPTQSTQQSRKFAAIKQPERH